MPRSLDIETLIEDAIVSLLPEYVDDDVTVTRWDDIKDKDLTPVVKVAANVTESQEGTWNLFCASSVLVDIAVFTSRRKDENGRTANTIRGQVRNLLNMEEVVDLLNNTQGLSVYNNGIIPQTTDDQTDGKVWQKQLTILVVATTN